MHIKKTPWNKNIHYKKGWRREDWKLRWFGSYGNHGIVLLYRPDIFCRCWWSLFVALAGALSTANMVTADECEENLTSNKYAKWLNPGTFLFTPFNRWPSVKSSHLIDMLYKNLSQDWTENWKMEDHKRTTMVYYSSPDKKMKRMKIFFPISPFFPSFYEDFPDSTPSYFVNPVLIIPLLWPQILSSPKNLQAVYKYLSYQATHWNNNGN